MRRSSRTVHPRSRCRRGAGDLALPYFNDEIGRRRHEQSEAADTMLLGRNTYQAFAEYWPSRAAR